MVRARKQWERCGTVHGCGCGGDTFTHSVGVRVLPHATALGVIVGTVGVQVEEILGSILTDTQVADTTTAATARCAHTLLDVAKGWGLGGGRGGGERGGRRGGEEGAAGRC